MRVTFLTHYYPPEAGAPQARISELARGLGERGVQVTVHTCFPHYPDGKIRAPYRNRPLTIGRHDAVRIVRSAVYPAPNRGFTRRLLNHGSFAASAVATGALAGPADVVVVETPPLFLAGAAVGYAPLKRAPLIAHVSDLWPDSAIELGTLSSPSAIRLARALERLVYRRSEAIVCPTEGIGEALRARPESAGKVHRIPPSVDHQRFAVGPPPAQGPVRVLYAGTLGLAQGVGTLVRAARRLRNAGDGAEVEVMIAGDGAESDELRAQVRRAGATNVRMLGAVPMASVPALYERSHLAVVLLRDRPLFRGALPTKIFEAMAAGRPVVLSGAGEAARLIAGSGAGVVVPPEDPDSLAAALRELASNRARAAALGAAGRRWVDAHHARSATVDRWVELFDAVAG